MLLKQTTKNIFLQTASISLINPIKRNLITSINKRNTIYIWKNGFCLSRAIASRNFFSSNKEEKKESKKEEQESKKEEQAKKDKESQNGENKNEEKEEEAAEKALNEKYKELKTLYNEQEQKLDQVKIKFHEIKDLYLKGIEEIDAIKHRNEREIKNTKDYAITKFAKDLLDVHDNFTRALSVIAEKDFKSMTPLEKDETFAVFVEGIEMTQKGLLNTLKKHGIILYDPKNEKFDPNKHEAVFDYEDDSLPPGTVGQVMQTGFLIGERVLRPAKVGVIKKK